MPGYSQDDSAGPVRVHRPAPGDRAALFPVLVDLYAAVYAEPPYREGPAEVARYAGQIVDDARRPGFTLVAASTGDQLVGVAYGWPWGPGEWFGGVVEEPAPEVLGSAKFVVLEWQVLAAYRGAGVGRALITALLVDRPEPFALLAADPRAAARAVYARAGWQPCGSLALAGGAIMDVLKLPL